MASVAGRGPVQPVDAGRELQDAVATIEVEAGAPIGIHRLRQARQGCLSPGGLTRTGCPLRGHPAEDCVTGRRGPAQP